MQQRGWVLRPPRGVSCTWPVTDGPPGRSEQEDDPWPSSWEVFTPRGDDPVPTAPSLPVGVGRGSPGQAVPVHKGRASGLLSPSREDTFWRKH